MSKLIQDLFSAPMERRASETWNNLPKVGGSRWGFIGVIAGVAVVVLLVLLIAIICCCKRSRSKKRMRHAAQGSDLSAFHPTPSYGQNASGAHRTKFTPLRGPEDAEEGDAFVATSPRDSFAYSRPSHKYNLSDTADDYRMKEMNNARYYGAGGVGGGGGGGQSEDDYARSFNYGAGGGYGGYSDPYGAQGQFVEPQYAANHNIAQDPYAPSATPALSSTSYAQTAPYSPSMTPQQHYQQPSIYPQNSQQQYSHYSSSMDEANNSAAQQYPTSPPQQHRQGGQAYAPSVAETAPPPYIPYQHNGDGAGGSMQSALPPIPMSPPSSSSRKQRAPGGAEI